MAVLLDAQKHGITGSHFYLVYRLSPILVTRAHLDQFVPRFEARASRAALVRRGEHADLKSRELAQRRVGAHLQGMSSVQSEPAAPKMATSVVCFEPFLQPSWLSTCGAWRGSTGADARARARGAGRGKRLGNSRLFSSESNARKLPLVLTVIGAGRGGAGAMFAAAHAGRHVVHGVVHHDPRVVLAPGARPRRACRPAAAPAGPRVARLARRRRRECAAAGGAGAATAGDAPSMA